MMSIYILNYLVFYISFLFLPNPPYKGLIKVFFQVVYAAAFTYFINICFLAILDHETIRQLLIQIDPLLAERIKERDYSIDCWVYTPENPNSNFANIKGTIDVYVVTHFFGWLTKTIIFRNNILLWTSSIFFEILEISLAHILPNFHECWWDHLLLDLFGCNFLGILIGMYIIKTFNLRKHHWLFEPTE